MCIIKFEKPWFDLLLFERHLSLTAELNSDQSSTPFTCGRITLDHQVKHPAQGSAQRGSDSDGVTLPGGRAGAL